MRKIYPERPGGLANRTIQAEEVLHGGTKTVTETTTTLNDAPNHQDATEATMTVTALTATTMTADLVAMARVDLPVVIGLRAGAVQVKKL